MNNLWFYEAMSRSRILNYRGKIMVMAFIGTHIPLITLASYFAFQSAADWHTFFVTVGITLVATLVGTGMTLFVLNELLRPVVATAQALRAYRIDRTLSALPRQFTDEAGTLMADAQETIHQFEGVRDVLEHMDAPTGLANRKGFVRDLEAAQAGSFAVAVIRLANASRLTQALNAATTDRALTIIAGRLRAAAPAGSRIARIGASDLAIMTDADVGTAANDALAHYVAHCSGRMDIDGTPFTPMLTSGVAVFPTDAADVETLVDHAMTAATSAIEDGAPVCYSPEARRRSAERLHLEQELRNAIATSQFKLHYQPVVDLAKGGVIGAEALIRWQHPERGLLAPAQFIPAAEASGLIDPIGLWVMREACQQARAWSDMGRDDLTMAINLSANQFSDPSLKGHVSDAIAAAKIRPSQLEIELTETAAMHDHDHTRRVFHGLLDLGVNIAIDDFGTGYASMSYLRKLPFTKLKIDREFVTDVFKKNDAQAICGALITLSKGLGLKVLAEGTESEQEVEFLERLGCALFQGYYFARPMPADEFLQASNLIGLRLQHKTMLHAPSAASLARAG